MFVRVLKDIPGESAFSKQSMSWKLMTCYRSGLTMNPLRYCATTCTTIATSVSCSSWLPESPISMTSIWFIAPSGWMRWEADRRVDGLGDAQEWQAPLWKALVEYTAELGQPPGIAPICTNALSARLKRPKSRPPGCRRESLFAGFRRCRRYICRRYRRWVSMSTSMSFH